MKKLLLIIGISCIVVSLVWAITQKDGLEPWTAFLGSLFTMLSFLVDSGKNESNSKQSNIISFFNKSRIKKYKGNSSQFNLFGFGNSQEIDNSEEEKTTDNKA